jgi:cytochrome c-type biogenesis protein CcmF
MLGNLLLYSSAVLGIISVISLLLKKDARWLVRGFAALLALDFLLLVYYFVTTNLTINYVWSYTSMDLPMFYKLSGVLGGQQGTLLFWAFLIGMGALWLNERRAMDSFIRGSQGVIILIGLYFIALTMLDSPFKTIYDANPGLDESFLPADGNGLNPLLIDPWMAVHPPFIFLGYAAMTVPFAVALVYLFMSLKGSTAKLHKTWVTNVVQWSRVSWLFLTLGIAVGGFWSYKVLGWGGFWAWDPVETSSLIPWLLLTGTLHALGEHRRDKNKYNVLTPALVGISFVLVIYATLVTRSGFFESIHAFGSGTVGTYLVILLLTCTTATLALALLKYLRTEGADNERMSSQLRTNIFYLAVMLFVVLTFISFWGVTFPALYKLFTGNKVSVGIAFFNIWSYPFILLLMLVAGLGINYEASKAKLREFAAYAALTMISAFIMPSDAWNIVDYSAIVSPEKPLLYTLVGSASSLSFIPPAVYILSSSYQRARKRIRAAKRRELKIKEAGTALVHAGVVFIIFGSVYSTLFASEFSASVATMGELYPIDGTPYSIRVADFKHYANFSGEELMIPSITVEEFYDKYNPGRNETYAVRGIIKDAYNLGGVALLRLAGKEKDLWVATNNLNFIPGSEAVAEGYIMQGFTIASLNMSFDYLMFSGNIRPLKRIISTTQEAEIEVYSGEQLLAHGIAKVVEYPQSDVKRVMIDRGPLRDVYVIFTGASGGEVPLTVKIIPLVNYLWLGILLFVIGIIAIMLYDPKYGVMKW